MLKACMVCGTPTRQARCPAHTIPARAHSRERQRQRQAVIRRDGEACSTCGTTTPPLIVHHRHDLAHGGADTIENLCLLCPTCHTQRHTEETPR